MSGRPAPDTRAEPAPSTAPTPLPEPAPASAEPAAAPAPSSAAPTRPDPVATAIAPLLKDPSLLSHTELGCARGNPDDCLLVGDFYARSDKKDDHHKRALIYRRRAIVLYAEKCHDRFPAACHVLSSLYAKGIGVPRNNGTAAALLQRSLELCKAHPNRPCVRQGLQVPPDLR